MLPKIMTAFLLLLSSLALAASNQTSGSFECRGRDFFGGELARIYVGSQSAQGLSNVTIVHKPTLIFSLRANIKWIPAGSAHVPSKNGQSRKQFLLQHLTNEPCLWELTLPTPESRGARFEGSSLISCGDSANETYREFLALSCQVRN